MFAPARARAADESGAVLVLFAALVTALFAMVAIVLDLSSLRQDRAAARAGADSAATAAALTLLDEDAPAACEAAWAYFLSNTPDAFPVATSPDCSLIPLRADCPAKPDTPVTGSAGEYTYTFVYPVRDDSPFMTSPDIIGGRAQVTVTDDGDRCDRVAVIIERSRSYLFAGVIDQSGASTTSRSVALSQRDVGAGVDVPALVALNQTAFATVNANTGLIEAKNNFDKPAIIHADSDGSGCSGSNYVLRVQNSAQGDIRALPGTTGDRGELGYFSPEAKGYRPGAPARYVGDLVQLDKRTTRQPVDSVYHCSASDGGCASGQTDYFADVLAPLETGDPGFTQVFSPALGDDCAAPPTNFPAGDWYIECDTFEVINRTVNFVGGGTIVMSGSLVIGANGLLQINTTSFNSTTGLPVHLVGADTLLVIRGAGPSAFDLDNATAEAWLARTAVFNVNGGMDLAGGATLRWSAKETAPGKDLLYWSESGATHGVQGSPDVRADGVLFAPNSPFQVVGNGTFDATNIQFWVDRVETVGTSRLLLRPNPQRAVSITRSLSSLIR